MEELNPLTYPKVRPQLAHPVLPAAASRPQGLVCSMKDRAARPGHRAPGCAPGCSCAQNTPRCGCASTAGGHRGPELWGGQRRVLGTEPRLPHLLPPSARLPTLTGPGGEAGWVQAGARQDLPPGGRRAGPVTSEESTQQPPTPRGKFCSSGLGSSAPASPPKPRPAPRPGLQVSCSDSSVPMGPGCGQVQECPRLLHTHRCPEPSTRAQDDRPQSRETRAAPSAPALPPPPLPPPGLAE